MVFSSPLFLFFFLPLTLLCYFLVPTKFRNLQLLIFSLFFYFWGEQIYTLVMLGVIIASHFIGTRLHGQEDTTERILFGCGIVIVLLPLLIYKYSGFIAMNLGWTPGTQGETWLSPPTHLPLGISFFTFQALSFLIDAKRGTVKTHGSFATTALYISLFPQLIAGPIVRYQDIAHQLLSRAVNYHSFLYGIQRFIIGLGKKVLIANPLGQYADIAFATSGDSLTAPFAWLGAICYSLQILYDFSGYSDMAIGLGKMFGFTIPENFNSPYQARSIQDFWRRWHISLSTWFKDYLYIPLGGNRKGPRRTAVNLLLVFFLCGLWHGANWTFICWGLFHGFFLAAERGRLGVAVNSFPVVLRHLYVFLVVVIGWVLFRCESLPHALTYLAAMGGIGDGQTAYYRLITSINPHLLLVLVLGILLSSPIANRFRQLFTLESGQQDGSWPLATFTNLALSAILLFSLASLAMGAYNPFIYFRF